jgi:hypothetical protein
MKYSYRSEEALRKLGRVVSPKIFGAAKPWSALRPAHWSFDESQSNGSLKFKPRKRKPGRPRKVKRVSRYPVEPKPKVKRVKEPSNRLINFREGDYVLFNPEREGYPTCIDGTVTRVRRCYDRRAQEFIVRLSIKQYDQPITWSVRYPGVPIRKVVK